MEYLANDVTQATLEWLDSQEELLSADIRCAELKLRSFQLRRLVVTRDNDELLQWTLLREQAFQNLLETASVADCSVLLEDKCNELESVTRELAQVNAVRDHEDSECLIADNLLQAQLAERSLLEAAQVAARGRVAAFLCEPERALFDLIAAGGRVHR
jgi:hypothetical protein